MQLSFTHDQLNDHHDYAQAHVVGEHVLHGGFDGAGNYVSPRSKTRRVAMDGWTAALEARGGDLFAADHSLLTGPRMPNAAQHALLLRSGYGRAFWNSLTVTGKIEARGRVLAEAEFPELQAVVVEDISEMAIGHLNKGLLFAHGIDEGGEPDAGIGGHDIMWFAARDLAFGEGAYPDVEPADSIGRPEAGKRWMPEIAPQFEGVLSFLMNLLLIEFRAEIFFATSQEILRDQTLFADRRSQADEAAEIVERIRTDEAIHVESLRLYLGELCELTLKTETGDNVPARPIIERFWQGLVRWAVHEQPVLAAQQAREALLPSIEAHGGKTLVEAFDACGDIVS